MRRHIAARIATLLVLLAALAIVVARKIDFRVEPAESRPQDAIYAMLDAARNGDVKRYLASYTAPMADELDRARADSSDFSRYLRELNASVKGVAIMEPQPQPDGQVQLRVEYVYGDRNESQFFYLVKTAGAWRISRIETAERVKTLIPYGTPVQ